MTTEAKPPNEMTYAEKANHYANLCQQQQREIAVLKGQVDRWVGHCLTAQEQDEEIFRKIRAELDAEGINGRVSVAAILFHIRGRGDDPDTYEDEDE